ncbi:ATP-dependent bile acid permease [Beauveria bassiana D1-5]|uniref:ATP-dependent bile acid permease n=1 Tax=Beauveria bassiana D1-5 TaxID=1245745 RepID=A0A0A2V8E7_BEABA|nr:ATP-dependent bile acid permease [Beauveria bassiana D1-5]
MRTSRKTLRSSRDRTTAILKEAFVSLREIKFSSLESQWESHIDAVREQELRDLSWSRTAVTIRGIWDTAGPFLVVIAALCAYMYTGGDITPSIVFPMINVLYQLQDTLSFVPTALNDYFHSIDTSGRIDTYLASAEQPLLVEPSPSGNIIFEDVTISWPSDHINEVGDDARFSLQNLNMEFPFGELSIVSGKTGSGKSLLLTGILDEAELVQGHIKAPSAQSCPNSVAYVAQVPWLHSGTIQENILLGSPLERERYNRVIAACALVPDFHALADGDQTQIGRRGIKLSGGQRTRVAFARALYSSAKTLILDDIFSTLDTQVSKEIICALTGEICKGRTRVLVTHHVSLCLPFAKYLVHLENNKVVYSGAPESAPKNILHMEAEDAKGIRTSGPASASSTLSHTGAATKFGTGDAIERKTASKSEWNYYRSYFIAAGGIQFGATFALLLVVSRLLNALTSYLLGRLKSHGPSRTASSELSTLQEDPTLFYSISLYIGAVALVIITTSLSKLHTDASTLRAARVLFRQMTFTVLRMPLIWLDATPVGAMLKAFTVDVRSVDELVLATLASFIDSAINVLTAICIGLYTSKYTSIATILLVAWCSKLVSRYKKASAMVRRTDGGPMADILEHVTSTSAGIATIRSFGASNTYIEAMQRYLDAESTAKRHFYIFSRWLTLQMSLLGIVFAMITGILLLTSESTNKVARVGFSLTFVMSLSNMISTTFSKFGYLELYMSSISSVMQYTEHDIEDPSGNDVAADWPSAGEIDVDDLQVGYSASLPPALKSVSFHVKRGEKVGIVGRTGAGKSSLTLSLLRLLNVQKGSISIDSIDISTIKVGDLRSRIGFIPQAPTLFCGTIRSNLDYFVQLSDGEINDALRHVGLLAEEGGADSGRFTAESPVAAGGENMSLGQRQLLCLARIILKNPMAIILDEATSAVDGETDSMIQDIIRKLFHGTLIVVAHRLETIVSFDSILVMGDGTLLEDGTPKELLNRKGAFYSLVEESQNSSFLRKAILGR